MTVKKFFGWFFIVLALSTFVLLSVFSDRSFLADIKKMNTLAALLFFCLPIVMGISQFFEVSISSDPVNKFLTKIIGNMLVIFGLVSVSVWLNLKYIGLAEDIFKRSPVYFIQGIVVFVLSSIFFFVSSKREGENSSLKKEVRRKLTNFSIL